jgi:branched-chain amino acid transport system substrate-binding protein
MANAFSQRQALRQIRRVGKWLALLGTVALSACQVVPKGPPRPVPVPEATRPDPVGQTLPADTARNRVALLVPMTGANAGVGESIANAANMAVLDTGGKTIRVTMYDTATGAAGAAQRAIAEGNRLILGPLLADDVRVVAPIARAAQVPVITFSNDVGVAGNGVYVMGFAPTQSIERIVRYARAKGVTKFAGLVPTGLYGQRASTAFLRSVQTYDRTAGSITAAITRMRNTSPYEAVLIADSARVSVQAAPIIRARGGASARLLGTELWNAEGALATNPALRGAWFASVSDGVYGQLSTKYRARFAKGPYRLASLGYDAVLLVSRVGSNWRFGSPFPVARLTDAGGFTGIDGAFRFARDGVAERALEVQQAGPTGFVVIDGAPKGF